MSDHVRAALTTIVEGGTLTLEEARLAMGAVMDGAGTPVQLAACSCACGSGETVMSWRVRSACRTRGRVKPRRAIDSSGGAMRGR